MVAKNINKIIFDTIATITNTDDFSFIVDDNDDIIQFVYKDNIVINIEYAEEPVPWDFSSSIKYPSDIQVIQKYNPSLDELDIIYYHAGGIIDMDNTTGDKLVVTLGDGRTEKYRNIAEFSKFAIPGFIPDTIHQWLPKHIIYRNYEEEKDYCSKSIYFFNQRINVFEGKTADKNISAGVTIPVTSERIYNIYHNSGFIYTMNRMNYNVKEFKENDDGSISFTIQTPIKMLDVSVINKDRTAQENTYIFTPDGGAYNCSEIYTKRKGIEISRDYRIETIDGIISIIKYYSGVIGSSLTRVRKVTRVGNKFTVTNIFDPTELEAYQ